MEYEHHQLPFARSEFPSGPLFVARSVLLAHMVAATKIPTRPAIRAKVGQLFRRPWERGVYRKLVRQANLTLAGANLINVCNTIERDTLVRHGHPADKICMFPFGLFPERQAAFRADPSAFPDPPVVGFVGTFDPRKGMCEFPALVDRVVRRIPGVTFRLLGTAGMVPDANGVLAYFPRRLWPKLDVHPRYDPNDLPGLLAGVSVGVFPSRIEGFPFGVLEMLAAAVPVICYDAPGPHLMVPPEFRVPVGAIGEMAKRVAALLENPSQLRSARESAHERSRAFAWEDIARRTADRYLAELGRDRTRHSGLPAYGQRPEMPALD